MMRSTELFKRRSEALGVMGPALVVMPESAPSLRAVTRALEALGFRTGLHHNARTALATIDDARPALVVHSAQLPDMDGPSFHAAVQRRAGGRRIPTLAIMPADRTPDQHFGKQTGMEYICTPFRAEDLASRLQGLLPRPGADAVREAAPVVEDRAPRPSQAVEARPAAEEPPPVSRAAEPAGVAEDDPSPPAPAVAQRPAVESRGAVESRLVVEDRPARAAPAVKPIIQAKDRPAPPAPEISPVVADEIHPAEGPELRVQVVGLGEWGRQSAELFAAHGIGARAVETRDSMVRSKLPDSRRHRVDVPRGALVDETGAAQALASDRTLGRALADADPDLFVVVGSLAGDAGSLMAALLRRLGEVAPRAGRLAVAGLPGSRSGPDERALGLLAMNAVLQAPPTGVLLVQPAGGVGVSAAFEANAALARLLELFDAASGLAGEPLLRIGRAALLRHLATPGFIGWREIELQEEMCAADAPGWHERLAAEQVAWQPEGFAWGEAQAIIPFVRAPRSWIEDGGRLHFDRLVRASWDEAAPCTMAPALYTGEPPAAILVSAGVPFPREVLVFRDSVEIDRARLAEKRRAAGTLIPLAEDFLPGEGVFAQPAPAPPQEEAAVTPAQAEPVPEAGPAPEVAPAVEAGPAIEAAAGEAEPEPIVTAIAPEPASTQSEPRIEAGPEAWRAAPAAGEEAAWRRAVGGPAAATEPAEFETADTFLPLPELAPAPSVYQRALALAGRILKSGHPGAEIDLGAIRYALYDLLEIVREDPRAILPEVFEPVERGYFERHHVNVAVLALLTGHVLRKSLSEVIDLGTAAMLHDIGMGETREAWDVDTRLSPTVFDRAVRPHPELGYRRLQEVPGMTVDVARMVIQEHERMDGTGYPAGMLGEAIDPGARILAVCDTLEALTHPRPFREHLAPAEALSRLQILGQYSLDSRVVEAATDAVGRLLPFDDSETRST